MAGSWVSATISAVAVAWPWRGLLRSGAVDPPARCRPRSVGCAHRRAGKDVAGCADPRSVAPWPPAKRSAHRQARHHPARTARPLVHVGAGHHPAARCAPAVRDRRLPNTPVILAEADGRVAAACPRARATDRRAGASRGLCGGGADGGRLRCPCMRVWQVAGPSRGAQRAAGWWPCVTFGRAGRAGWCRAGARRSFAGGHGAERLGYRKRPVAALPAGRWAITPPEMTYQSLGREARAGAYRLRRW